MTAREWSRSVQRALVQGQGAPGDPAIREDAPYATILWTPEGGLLGVLAVDPGFTKREGQREVNRARNAGRFGAETIMLSGTRMTVRIFNALTLGMFTGISGALITESVHGLGVGFAASAVALWRTKPRDEAIRFLADVDVVEIRRLLDVATWVGIADQAAHAVRDILWNAQDDGAALGTNLGSLADAVARYTRAVNRRDSLFGLASSPVAPDESAPQCPDHLDLIDWLISEGHVIESLCHEKETQ
ncbi:hypothetical protein [Nocardioides sp. InS609-2]|uniref:hypothetical protein n=1 Tax=Nocardioides sp. InS609-2 TaxID=2760705 RepID=UPI0020C0EBB9|nr:hypothetical protein [Nocardioides sp. InS609-2]